MGHVAGRYLEVRIVVGWSRSGGGHATGLEGTSSAQYSEIHTNGENKLNTTTNNTDANTSSTTISDYQQQQQHNTASTISNTH